LVGAIYRDELQGSKLEPPKLRRIMLLEISQYLENYLIPNCTQVRTRIFPFPAIILGIAVEPGEHLGWDFVASCLTKISRDALNRSP